MALIAVSLCSLAVLVFVVLLGDTRRFEVLLATPETDATTSSTLRSITLTFSAEPDRQAIESRLSLDPPVPGTIRWRGKVMEYIFDGRLDPGPHRLTIGGGALGRAGEQLAEAFELAWTVREPGVLVVKVDGSQQQLWVERDGQEASLLYKASRVIDFAVAPDGETIAVVAEDAAPAPNVVPPSRLALIETATGAVSVPVDTPQLSIGAVSWSADSQLLLVVRREKLPGGGDGVPRAWVMRRSGEFIQPVDIDGQPSISAAWSPDGQWVGYVAPATAALVAWNIASQETRILGRPRSTTVAWSRDSRLVAFESVPPESQDSTNPLQPIAVRGLDLEFELQLGAAGETRSYPRFSSDGQTVMSVRRLIGERLRTDLVFESVASGELLRAVLLTDDSALVTSWDIDPAGKRVVFVRRFGNTATAVVLDLETLEMTELEGQVLHARWVP